MAGRAFLPSWTSLRAIVAGACVVLALGSGSGWAQSRATVDLGLAGRTTAGAWTPVLVEVRDAPGARVRIDLDAGGLQRGSVPLRAERTLPVAGGVQRDVFALPLPRWRSLSWRVEHADRVLASGATPTRDRDDRPLHLLLGTAAAPPTAEDDDPLGPPRTVRVTVADLPQLAPGWDGVASLWIDGTVAAPDVGRIVTAAVAGVRVHVRTDAPPAFAPLLDLVRDGPRSLGAGAIVPWSPETEVAPAGDEARAWRSEVHAYVADAIDTPPWRHAPRGLVGWAAFGYLLACWVLLRIGGPAGLVATGVLITAALTVAPTVAPARTTEEARATVTVVDGGLGLRGEVIRLAAQPAGDRVVEGLYRTDPPRPLVWEEDRTRIFMATGERVRLFGPPEVVQAPASGADARLAGAEERTADLAAFAGRATPPGARLLQDGSAWWWLPADGGASVARAGGSSAAPRGTP